MGLMLSLTAPFSAFSQRDARFASVRQKIEGLLASQKIPAISIGVAEKGKIVWQEGFGLADRETRKSADHNTIYNIASTSKPITATAIMMLAEQGKIALDLPANDFLSKEIAIRSPFGDLHSLSVRRLLDHTSGLSRHSQHFTEGEIRLVPQIDETIMRHGVTTKPVGESFEYSNLGYGILSRIVTQRSGSTFSDFIKRQIFAPLEMKNSHYGKPNSKSVATAYDPELRPARGTTTDTPGASDIYSSAHDLLLFGMFLSGEVSSNQKPLLNTASLNEMKKDSSDRGISKYGLGLESVQMGKYKLIFHHGSNGYGTSIFALLPEKRICISILSNVTTAQTAPLVDEILKILVSDYEENLDDFRKARRAEESRPYRLDENYRGHWKGTITTWKEEIPVEMWFQDDGDIQIQMKGQYKNLLNGARFEEQYLRGSFQGNINTPDANRHRYNLHIKLRLRNSKTLNGAITSSSYDPQGNVLSSWISLERQP